MTTRCATGCRNLDWNRQKKFSWKRGAADTVSVYRKAVEALNNYSGRRMKVLYDMLMLGQARSNVKSRTGVFRVVYEVARQLVDSSDIDLIGTVSDATMLYEVMEFLREDNALSGVMPRYSSALKYLARLCRTETVRRYSLDGKTLWANVNRNAARLTSGSLSRLTQISAALESRRSLEGVQLYHSPFDALPVESLRWQRALTVYDLIPIRFPEFMTEGHVNHFQRIVASLKPDDMAICISEATRNDLCDIKKHPVEHTHVAPLAAAPDKFYPCKDKARLNAVRRQFSIPDGQYFLSLSTLEPRKNIETVIKAFADMVRQQRYTDVSLVLVGAMGWKYDNILAATKKVLGNKLVITGFVKDEDMSPLYSGASGFFYLSHYEGFGLPPLEAMQCGVPVVTSNTSSLPEVVGKAGVMLSPTDAEGASEMMVKLYCDADYRARQSALALDQANHFSWKRCADETVVAYRKALG